MEAFVAMLKRTMITETPLVRQRFPSSWRHLPPPLTDEYLFIDASTTHFLFHVLSKIMNHDKWRSSEIEDGYTLDAFEPRGLVLAWDSLPEYARFFTWLLYHVIRQWPKSRHDQFIAQLSTI